MLHHAKEQGKELMRHRGQRPLDLETTPASPPRAPLRLASIPTLADVMQRNHIWPFGGVLSSSTFANTERYVAHLGTLYDNHWPR